LATITIAIDAMGGDQGPAVTVPAAIDMLKKHATLRLILVGDTEALKQQLLLWKAVENERLIIQHASQVVGMDELPSIALRTKKDSSMRVAINLVKQGMAQAAVSAGNTGALMAIARFVLKTIPGIDRPAISAVLPTMKAGMKVRVLDLGANVDSEVEYLMQFAVMGSVLTSAVDNIKNPSVGLLNIGAEEIKGNDQVKKAAQLLSHTPGINYIGYVEGDEIYKGVADVVVCDGFVGNVALKVTEGAVKMMGQYTKEAFKRNWLTRLSGLLALHVLKGLRKRMDPARYNGASLVGLQGIVIKSHGSANRLAFENAIHEALSEVEKDIPQRIRKQVMELLQSKPFSQVAAKEEE
jgi:glycerol-3-phosphate acyltransferase PlsX